MNKKNQFKIAQADKMRRRKFFSKMEVTAHENKVRPMSSNQNQVETLRHVTEIRGHNYVRFLNFGNFFIRRFSKVDLGKLEDQFSWPTRRALSFGKYRFFSKTIKIAFLISKIYHGHESSPTFFLFSCLPFEEKYRVLKW